MGQREIPYTVNSVSRAVQGAIMGARKAGIEIKSLRILPTGEVVINGDDNVATIDTPPASPNPLEFEDWDQYDAWREDQGCES